MTVQYSVRKSNRADVKNKNGALTMLLDAIPFNVFASCGPKYTQTFTKQLIFEEFSKLRLSEKVMNLGG
jgi:hypothetical protein